jgi:hypothetical protein
MAARELRAKEERASKKRPHDIDGVRDDVVAAMTLRRSRIRTRANLRRVRFPVARKPLANFGPTRAPDHILNVIMCSVMALRAFAFLR